ARPLRRNRKGLLSSADSRLQKCPGWRERWRDFWRLRPGVELWGRPALTRDCSARAYVWRQLCRTAPPRRQENAAFGFAKEGKCAGRYSRKIEGETDPAL